MLFQTSNKHFPINIYNVFHTPYQM